MNVPVPVASVVREPAIVGLVAVPQHTPRAVIALPPSTVILPPETAALAVMPVAAVVVRVARTTCDVVNSISAP